MTALTAYLTNTTGTTLTTTYKLSITHGTDNTNVTQNYSLLGTATGYGEVAAQGATGAWAAGGSIGSPTGKGFMLESGTLNLAGNTIAAGSWTANVRLCSGHTDGTQTGSLTGCAIHVRVYKYNGGTYTSIIDMSLTSQTINSTLATYALSGTTGSSTALVSGDLIYVDIWVQVGTNSNADAALNIRNNRLSTNSTGDSNAEVVTPGYASSATTSNRTIPATAALKSTLSRTISSTAALKSTNSRTISATATLTTGATTSNRTIPATAALKSTKSRTVSATAALKSTNSRTVPTTVALKSTLPRTIPATATLTKTSTRTIPSTVTLKATKSRTIPVTAALTGGIVYDPTIQMDMPTLTAQYARLISASMTNTIKIIATVYFSNSVNNSVILGQLCIVMSNETITNLHSLNTINDVTAFIATH